MPLSSPDEEHLVGGLGFVTTRIRGRSTPGEVQVALNGGSEVFIAYADEAIDRGVQVVILERRPGRTLVVTPFGS